jgi:hypothetical protein
MSDLRQLLHAAAPSAPPFDRTHLAPGKRHLKPAGARLLLVGFAAVIIVALATVVVVGTGGGSPQPRTTTPASSDGADGTPTASVQAMRAALGAWSAFPVDASPRPLVLLDDPVTAPRSGFVTTEAKEAFLSGAFVASTVLPAGAPSANGLPIISADQALEAMRAEGTPAANAPSPPAPLTISGARFGSAPFKTDRGTTVLPAWLFTFRGVADPAAVLAVAPSSRFPAPAASRGRSSVGAQLGADGRTATISFTGAKPGSGPCTASYTVDQLASATAIAIRVRAIRNDIGGQPCAALGYPRRAVVRLTSPLGRRVLVDATTTGPVATAP